MVVATSDQVDIAELKARHILGDAVEAAGVVLRGKGRVRQGICPFHDEAEGSFTVYANSERFYCFGCGAGGDVLDFVGRMEGLTLPEAIRRLDDGSTPVVFPGGSSRVDQATHRPCDSAPGPGAADGGGTVLRRPTAAQSGGDAIPGLAGHRPGRCEAVGAGLRAGQGPAGTSASRQVHRSTAP